MGVAAEVDFLRIREILKQRIRKERKKAMDSSTDDCSVEKKKLPKPFFGPSQHSISPRLIQGMDALMQEFNISSQDLQEVEIPTTTTAEEESESESELPLTNAAKLKESRDYSFLSSHDADQDTKGEPGVGKDSVSKSSDDEQRDSANLKSDKLGRPQKTMSRSQKPSSDKRQSTPENKSTLEKLQSQTKRRLMKPAKQCLEPNNTRVLKNQVKHHVEELEDEDNVDVSSIIQGMFRRNRKRPSALDYDDGDDRAMVSSFSDIQREERKSAKLAKKEDEIEALRIEQEEHKERLRKANKKKLPKPSNNYLD